MSMSKEFDRRKSEFDRESLTHRLFSGPHPNAGRYFAMYRNAMDALCRVEQSRCPSLDVSGDRCERRPGHHGWHRNNAYRAEWAA